MIKYNQNSNDYFKVPHRKRDASLKALCCWHALHVFPSLIKTSCSANTWRTSTGNGETLEGIDDCITSTSGRVCFPVPYESIPLFNWWYTVWNSHQRTVQIIWVDIFRRVLVTIYSVLDDKFSDLQITNSIHHHRCFQVNSWFQWLMSATQKTTTSNNHTSFTTVC